MQKIIVGGGVGGARFLGIHFDLDKKVEFAIRGQTKKKRRAKNDDSEAIKIGYTAKLSNSVTRCQNNIYPNFPPTKLPKTSPDECIYILKRDVFKSAQKVSTYLVSFVRKFVAKTFKNRPTWTHCIQTSISECLKMWTKTR